MSYKNNLDVDNNNFNINEPNIYKNIPKSAVSFSNKSKIIAEEDNLLKKIIRELQLKECLIKVFGSEKTIIISCLMSFRKIIKETFPSFNNLLFKEKYSSLVLTYTFYTSTYYSSQNSEADSLVYKSILDFCLKNKITGVKYITNTAGSVNYFDKNQEIFLTKNIIIDTKVTTSSTAIYYEIELYSYSYKQNKLLSFIDKTKKKYLKKMMNTSNFIGNPNQKYFNYSSFNISTNTAIFEEVKFYSNKTFDNIFFYEKQKFIDRLKYFQNNRSKYIELGIPYSFGVILYGPPGTGKTSCIKAIANITGRSIIDVNLNKVKYSRELKSIMFDSKINNVEVPSKSKIFVFEEFDCIIDIVKKRNTQNDNSIINNSVNNFNQKNIHNNHNQNNENINESPIDNLISLDSFLTIIDGTREADGSIIVLTTNLIEKIDKALIRPGRFDYVLNLENAPPIIILEIFHHFIKDKKVIFSEFLNKNNHIIEEITPYCFHLTKLVWSPAKITQICILYIDKHDFLECCIKHIKDNYDNEILLLN